MQSRSALIIERKEERKMITKTRLTLLSGCREKGLRFKAISAERGQKYLAVSKM